MVAYFAIAWLIVVAMESSASLFIQAVRARQFDVAEQIVQVMCLF